MKRSTPRERVQEHLCDLGFAVAIEDITWVRGYWAHNHQDVIVRWYARVIWANDPEWESKKKQILICAFDSLTNCARGMWVVPASSGDTDGDFECYSRAHNPTKPNNALETHAA